MKKSELEIGGKDIKSHADGSAARAKGQGSCRVFERLNFAESLAKKLHKTLQANDKHQTYNMPH